MQAGPRTLHLPSYLPTLRDGPTHFGSIILLSPLPSIITNHPNAEAAKRGYPEERGHLVLFLPPFFIRMRKMQAGSRTLHLPPTYPQRWVMGRSDREADQSKLGL
ncbi:hypothetical protein JTE90_009769 [Oedothorax gibbosus]|uniref:Uncharacterized protein n=1 Tax=Oedothorax gibbosus TaxID=931172 RepID=A0AAV6VA70_9ARAC|nr:hypothetical protein JTE90_009769 [Oedothorax gibbosus]